MPSPRRPSPVLRPLGLYLEDAVHEQAERLQRVMGGSKSAVLRAALRLGLTELERRHPEADEVTTVAR